jgi:hypothetical protein
MRSSVLATAQSHTHFLDSARIREACQRLISASRHEAEKLSIYVILPATASDFDAGSSDHLDAIIETPHIDIEPKPVLSCWMRCSSTLKPSRRSGSCGSDAAWGSCRLSQLTHYCRWRLVALACSVLQSTDDADTLALCGRRRRDDL